MFNLTIVDGTVTDVENETLEFKSALKGIPNSIWETYSSFANSFGGTIVLGIQDTTKTIEGVPHAEQRVQEIWNNLNNPQVVNYNILRCDDVTISEYEGRQLIIINVPRADRHIRPIYYRTLESGTFKRNGEGDYHCTMPEIASFMRDQSSTSYDSTLLENTSFDDIDIDTFHDFRNEMKVTQPDHLWNKCKDEEFARKIGVIGHSTTNITVAGLLMFGKGEVITSFFPRFKLDYMECPMKNTSWTYRKVSGNGCSESNVYGFFSLVRSRISMEVDQPLVLDAKMRRIMDTDVHKAIREGLLNCLIHADYLGNLVVKIERYPKKIIMSNSGLFRIPLTIAEKGGRSDPRNMVMAGMFSLIGLSERAGVGINYIFDVWQHQFRNVPKIVEDTVMQETSVEFNLGTVPKSKPLDEEIIAIMKREPAASLQDIAKILGVSRPTIVSHVKVLKDAGLIERIGGTRGHWECR